MVVRAHNRWKLGWPLVITLVGWFAILAGLFRMFAAQTYVTGAQGSSTALLAGEIVLLAVGVFLTIVAYRPGGGEDDPQSQVGSRS